MTARPSSAFAVAAIVATFGFASASPASALCCACATAGTTAKTCLTATTGACGTLVQQSGNASLAGVSCQPTAIPDAQCQPVGQSPTGICAAGPFDVASASAAQFPGAPAASSSPISPLPTVVPTPSVAIPGLVYGQVYEQDNKVVVPFIAQFVSAAYRYLVGISAIAAAIMVVYGGLLYLLGESVGSAKQGKTYIEDALIGLFLVLGSYTILRTVNPALVEPPVLRLPVIRRELLEIGNYNATERPGQTTLSTGSFQAPADLAQAVPGNPDNIAEAIKAGAKEGGVDACLLLAVCHHETGLRSIWSGIQAGNPMESGVAFGPCQVHRMLFTGKGGLVKKLKGRYSDFPDEADAKTQIEWMLKHPDANAYLAAGILRANIGQFNNNELAGISGYGAGALSVKQWQSANGCIPQPGSVAQAAGKSADDALKSACVPETVAIAAGGKKACADDKFVCADLKPNTKAELVGHCPSDPESSCFGMKTDEFARYVLRMYPIMKQKYQCAP